MQTKPGMVMEGAAPKHVFKKGEKLEINPLLLQAFGITPEDIAETIKSAEEPEKMRDMFAFMSDYAALSHPKTRPLISGDKLDFLVADIKRRMAHVAGVYRGQAEDYGFYSETGKRLLKISEKAQELYNFQGTSRLDKIAFIDAVMHLEHTSGSVLPVAFGITDYGREDYWPRKLLAFLRTHGMPGMVKEGTTPDRGNYKEGLSVMIKEQTNNGFKADPNLINKERAMRSHSGTSWDPEKRGEQEIAAFAAYVQEFYERLKKHAKTDRQKEYLLKEMERFQSSFASKYNAKLSAQGGCLSTMIAGPSNFPTGRAQKACSAADKRYEELIEFRDRAETAILRELKKMGVEEAGGELEVLKKKIADAERNHEFMIKTNAIVRKKIPDDQKIREIMALAPISEKTAREILKPDFMGRVGFPAYALSNDTANIHRMKERLKELEKKEATPTGDIHFTGGVIQDSREYDRVRIFFDTKPEQSMIDKLKAEGWRWSPAMHAWQRKRTDAALHSAKRITGAAQPAISAVQPPAHVIQPPAAPRITAPHPYAIPELRWVYGTQDLKWHLVGHEDRDYAHGITQARMRQIGAEAARAEYLSPSLARAPAQQITALPSPKRLPLLYPAPEAKKYTTPRIFEKGTIARNNITNEKFVLETDVEALQEDKNARIWRTNDGHYIYIEDQQPVATKEPNKITIENTQLLKFWENYTDDALQKKIRLNESKLKALAARRLKRIDQGKYGTMGSAYLEQERLGISQENSTFMRVLELRKLKAAEARSELVAPLSPEYERIIKAYLEKRGHELTLREFIWADKYTLRGTAKYPARTMEEKRKREEFVLKNYDEETGKKYHRGTVESALKRGLKVPDMVLIDYPDIVALIRAQAAPPIKAVPAVPPAPRKFVQQTFQVEERMRRYVYA